MRRLKQETEKIELDSCGKYSVPNLTYIDLLEIDLLSEHRIFWLFPDLNTKGNVRALNDIAPEASNHDMITHFVFLNIQYEISTKGLLKAQ